MRKKLLILNYQREVPPFLQTQVKFAKDFFDDIYYVTPKLYNDNTETICYENVRVVIIKKTVRVWSYIRTLIGIWFNHSFWREFFRSNEVGESTAVRIKHFLTIDFVSYNMYRTAEHLLKNRMSDDKISVLAGWFSNEAMAAALLKEQFPQIKTYSFAHSYEIHPGRNRMMPYCYNKLKHENIDRVFFISETMRELYDEGTAHLYEKELKEKSDVLYLGSVKLYDKGNELQELNKFRVCTCSSVVALKRLDLLLDAIERWNLCNLEWTHIGGGYLFQAIKKRADKIMESNDKVKIKLLGKFVNSDVQKYYSEEEVDLFVNISEVEGLPVSIMEAISYGIPILATDVGGTKEIVDEKNGFLVPASLSAEDLKSYLEKFYLLPLETKIKYRNNSIMRWHCKFDTSKTAPEFYKILSNGKNVAAVNA